MGKIVVTKANKKDILRIVGIQKLLLILLDWSTCHTLKSDLISLQW